MDVHKKNVVACVLAPPKEKQIRTFGTTTGELRRLLEWLKQERVSDLAMESTGSYWKPVYNVLEGQGIRLLVVNPAHMKAIPGRKTDVKDAEWIADLLRHGLLRGSRIFEREQRELQELMRYRVSLSEERGDEVRRLQKVLEGGNVKLGDVAADVLGVSGRAILNALAEGDEDPSHLAALAQGRLKNKREALERALESRVGDHQRFMLRRLLRHIEFLDQEIATVSAEVEARMRPFQAAIATIDEVPGVGRVAAERVLAEIGVDMSYWANQKKIASWAKLSPGNNVSAGKRRSSSIGAGNKWLRGALVQAAWGAVRVVGSQFAALFQRLRKRRGDKRAIIAVAHRLLVIIYAMLRDGTKYQEPRVAPSEPTREALVERDVRHLQKLGYIVTLQPAA